jgi:hypothetical protein
VITFYERTCIDEVVVFMSQRLSGASPSSQKVPSSEWGFRQLSRGLLYFAYEFLSEFLSDRVGPSMSVFRREIPICSWTVLLIPVKAR